MKYKRMISKTITIFFLITILNTNFAYATDKILESQMETLNISSFIKKGEEYSKNVFPDISGDKLLDSAIKGKVDKNGIFNNILSILGKEVVNSITLLGSIIIVIVIHSILKSITENIGNESISEIAYYIEYILIATLIMTSFSGIIGLIRESMNNLIGLTTSLVPILLALMVATGNVVSAGFLETTILFAVVFIGNIITTVILPITLVANALGIISNISEKIQIGKLATFFKSGVIWFLGFVIVIFVSILSLEGTLTSSVDRNNSKRNKNSSRYIYTSCGKSTSEILQIWFFGCASLLKNAVGVVGMIIIVGIVAFPIIKLAILTVSYHFVAAICEPMADKKIISLLEQMGGTFKILLGIMFFIAALLIIGLAMTVKISNASLMYR